MDELSDDDQSEEGEEDERGPTILLTAAEKRSLREK